MSAVKTAQREAKPPSASAMSYIEATSSRRATSSSRCWPISTGNVVHLGERECSIQRRHQKLIEESPSPALTDKMRRKMGSIVIDAAKAVHCTNAGTFEF